MKTPAEAFAHEFAVLALWLVADAMLVFQPKRHDLMAPTVPAPLQWTHAGKYAIDAMEAVCIADEMAMRYYADRFTKRLLKDGDGVEAAVRKRISVQAQAAAIKKHSTNRLPEPSRDGTIAPRSCVPSVTRSAS
ncbi:hypothetical protein [Ralstonia solanacearum]|uniref:hypothetical protein n=1 Tax=Ralstonia solanacearum TaxID=305 RepID=UPI000E57FF84|nr:hypothetical protein [Ralstonia solanacearum]